ncbi:unnamed protein product [Prorocentrum cordatum]|uniref:Uncharacterized protein n=1 Tax=Prorocentrum cordatum TaxID=2364126 RepID=A0ABN9Q9S4_9DINO|nr:unnamed protein product [Polarella glacialis]
MQAGTAGTRESAACTSDPYETKGDLCCAASGSRGGARSRRAGGLWRRRRKGGGGKGAGKPAPEATPAKGHSGAQPRGQRGQLDTLGRAWCGRPPAGPAQTERRPRQDSTNWGRARRFRKRVGEPRTKEEEEKQKENKGEERRV